MARRPDRHETEVLSKENLKEIKYNLAHLSLAAVRDAAGKSFRDHCYDYHFVNSCSRKSAETEEQPRPKRTDKEAA